MSLLLRFFPALAPYALLIEIALLAALAAAVVGYVHHRDGVIFHNGELATQAKWDKERVQLQARALAEANANAAETARRLKAQQDNQEAQNRELAQARADADRARSAVDRMQRSHQAAADIWGRTLRNSPTSADLEAAAAAIRMQAELLGRARERDRIRSAFADASRAAGLKCERDYESLTAPVKP